LNTLLLSALVAGAGFVGYRFLRAQVEADVYKRRLTALAGDYESLRDRYNAAVARSTVTELVVREGVLYVRVRNASGLVEEIRTPFDPRGEIYVDFVVIDQRLWIRRVFDALTAPDKAMVIDPALAKIDWSGPGAGDRAHGKAVYRALGEGRWVIQVSGDGSLSLQRAEGGEGALERAPEIQSHREMPEEARREAAGIGAGDVWRWLTGP
jgi:hypothetical protein